MSKPSSSVVSQSLSAASQTSVLPGKLVSAVSSQSLSAVVAGLPSGPQVVTVSVSVSNPSSTVLSQSLSAASQTSVFPGKLAEAVSLQSLSAVVVGLPSGPQVVTPSLSRSKPLSIQPSQSSSMGLQTSVAPGFTVAEVSSQSSSELPATPSGPHVLNVSESASNPLSTVASQSLSAASQTSVFPG